MTTGTPYIGSRISLVSKAEIRYEGVLYDVDSKEATVTLSKVKSFGTENRQAPKQIPPRNEVYEYIIFRGSDIKDLSVSELGNKDESPHLDPAIVSAQTVPPVPSSHSEPNPAFLSRNPGGTSSILPTPPHPVPPGGGYTQFPPPGYNPFGMPPYFGRPPLMMGQHLPPRPMNSPANQGHLIPHPSTPPTHISSISSVSQSISSTSQKTPQSSIATVAPPTNPTVVSNTTSTTTSQFTPAIAASTGTTPQNISRNTTSDKPQVSTEHHKPSTDPTVTDTTNTTTTTTTSRPVESQRHSSSPTTTTPGNDGRRQAKRGGYRDNRDYQQQRYPNYTSKGPRVVNNWRGGGDRGYTRTPRRGGVSSRPPQPDSQPLKYTEDFDFESANALFSKDQFEKEIKSKLQIDDQKEGGANVNDHTPQEEEGRVEEVAVEGDKGESNVEENYDKTKSFFDSLTCESNKQNTNRRSNRSHEMALNTETFGTTNRGYYGRPRRNHGRGYRYGGGRGGYNHYNGYGRGGGGYRGRGGYQEGRGGNRTYEDRSYGNRDGGRSS